MATLKTVLHPKTDKKGNREYRLALRLTVNRKRSYYHLGQKLDQKFWDDRGEKVKYSHPRHKQLNRLIRKKYDEIEDVIFNMEANKQKYTAKHIIECIRNNTQKLTFFELADQHIEELTSAKNYNRAISDKSKIKRINEFVKKRNISFEEIDEYFLKTVLCSLIALVVQNLKCVFCMALCGSASTLCVFWLYYPQGLAYDV